MPRSKILYGSVACALLAVAVAHGQNLEAYQTTPDLLEAMQKLAALKFATEENPAATPLIEVDDTRRFQQMDGFGASLTDAAAWLLGEKLRPEETESTMRSLFSRRDGIALSFLRQPVGSSDLAVTFYSFDDLCKQAETACTTPAGSTDPGLAHFSLAHDEKYILPLLKKAIELNPELKVMLTPWSPPGWMKSSGSMLGVDQETKQPATLRPAARAAFAKYLVKTVAGYQAAGVPVFALSVQNEPLYATPNYSGMLMPATEQADFLGNYLAPAMAAAGLRTKVMAYDHNWDRPDYPEAVLRDAKAGALVAGTAWHHYAGDPIAMTRIHEEFPQKDEWVTEASGGSWQKGSVLAQEGAELVASARNWARSYVLWALATDQDHGPHVGGCDTCRGLVTVELDTQGAVKVRREPDYYVLGQASKFVLPGAVRIESNEPEAGGLRDVAFRNPNGTIVLYVVNIAEKGMEFRIGYKEKTAATTIPAGSVATYLWKP